MEDLQHVGSVDYGAVGTGMGCVCGHRLGRPEEFLATGPSRLPAAGARGIGEHPGSRGGLGSELTATFWWPAHRRVSGTISRGLGLYAHQVPAPGAVPRT